MEYTEFLPLLQEGFARNGLERYAAEPYAGQFWRLTERMEAVNAVMNLTAIKEPAAVIAKHYADSLLFLTELPEGATVLDVGCGAGFPSLPLAIVRPDLRITALDSTAKRVRYVAETAELLGLSDVQTCVARAEEAGQTPAMREHFDFVTARAVAALPVLCELCMPFLRVGGRFLALKGRVGSEADDAKNAIRTLGGRLGEICDARLLCPDGAEEERALLVIEKITYTPRVYPRAFAQMSKKPL
jgi:16S rRNA (guanine527-N7)-methyltransferase